MVTDEVRVEFKVFYKAKADYTGHFNRQIKPGLHGSFDTMADAKLGAAKCRDWFGREMVFAPRTKDGVVTEEWTSQDHDNVEVWVEEWRDGRPRVQKKEAKKEPA